MKASLPIGRLGATVLSLLLSLLGSFTATAADTNIIAWPANFLTNVPSLTTNAIAVTGGDSYGIALLADRTVQTWGTLGSGGSNVPPPDATNIVSITAGTSHALAVRSDGTVALWGRIAGNSSTAVPPEVTNVVTVGLGPGAQHALALRADGTVVDWGLSDTTNIPSGVLNIVSVAAGSFHSLALRSDGRVFAWGRKDNGATTVPASATNIVAIATTWYGNIALRGDGKLLTWGSDPAIPGQTTLTNIVEVAGKGGFSGGGMALNRNGKVFATGAPATATNIMAIGGSGQTYMGVQAVGPPIFPLPAVRRTVAATQTAYLRLRAVGALPLTYQWSFQGTNLPGATNAVLVVTNALPAAAGFYSLVASNAVGVVTNSEMDLVIVPIIITNQLASQATYVGASPTLKVGVLGPSPTYQWAFNGTNIAWGTNSSLTLTNIQPTDAGAYSVLVSNGFGGVVSADALVSVWPILVTQPPQDQVTFRGATMALSIAAQASPPLAYQWQFNGTDLPGATDSTLSLTNVLYEQAGSYTVIASTADAVVTNFARLTVVPVAAWGSSSYGETNVPPDLTNVVAMAAGQIHSLALKNDGTVVAWRYDSIRTNVPSDLTNAVAVSAGSWGSLALRSDGTIAAWGYNNRGQTNIPPELTNVVAVAAGGYHNLALKPDGTVVAWGQNDSGQTNVPPGLMNVVAVEAGDYTSLALTANGGVVAWGQNGNGQTNVPGDLSNVVAIAAGSIHCIALKSDGNVTVWGATNSYGLGTIPMEATNIVAIGAGYGHCLALRDDGLVIAWGYSSTGETAIPTGLHHVTTIASGSFYNLALVGGTPFDSPVLVANPTWITNGFNISVPTRSGRVYRLEYKANLSDGSWIALPLVAGTGGTLTLTDSAAAGTQRFYRVRRW